MFGRKDDSLEIKWKPLRVMSEKEQAEIKSQKLNSLVQLVNIGILSPKQLAEQLVNEKIITLSDEELNVIEDEVKTVEDAEKQFGNKNEQTRKNKSNNK